MHDGVKHQAYRVDKDVALLTLDLLPRVVARRRRMFQYLGNRLAVDAKTSRRFGMAQPFMVTGRAMTESGVWGG